MNSKLKEMISSKQNKQSNNWKIILFIPILFCVLFLMSFTTAIADILSLDLTQSINMAYENNHDISIAKYKIEEANAGVKSARTNFLPKLKSQATYTKLDEIPYLDASAFGGQ